MSVIANSNKQILWEVLNGMIEENNLKITNISLFQNFFEERCKYYHVRRFDYKGLSTINKHVVSDCFDYLKKLSNENSLVMFREFEEYGNKRVVKNLQVGKRYKEHEENFNELINAKKPNEIDFNEIVDKPIKNMDDELTRAMAARQNQLSTIQKTYDQGDIKWLSSGGVPKLNIVDDGNTNIALDVQDLNKYTGTTRKNENIEKTKKMIDEKKKKVRFESSFINSIRNSENGENMARKMIREDLINQNKEKYASRQEDLISEITKGYIQPSERMLENYERMNQEYNQQVEKEQKEIEMKNNIIKEINTRDLNTSSSSESNTTKNEKTENISLQSIFSNMKIKTKNSDIIAATSQDTEQSLDLSKRMDKLENYLVEIMKNQIQIINKLNTQPINYNIETIPRQQIEKPDMYVHNNLSFVVDEVDNDNDNDNDNNNNNNNDIDLENSLTQSILNENNTVEFVIQENSSVNGLEAI